jgi:hypothetical protein
MAIDLGAFRAGMPMRERTVRHYDVHTAITFLMAGLGIGSLLTLLLVPRPKSFGSFVRNPASVRPSPAL